MSNSAKTKPRNWAEAKAWTKIGRTSVDKCLYLYLQGNGSRTWLFRYRDRGSQKLRDMGLGSVEVVSLKDAKEQAAALRLSVLRGEDPIANRRKERAPAPHRPTFGECAGKYIAAHSPGWRNVKHARQWSSTLATHAVLIMAKPVDTIDTADLIAVLDPIWTVIPETASRLRQRIERILDWARSRGMRSGENPARWRGHLEHSFPAASKVKKVNHRPALPYQDAPEAMRLIRQEGTLAARALELMILTTTRPGEACGARWADIDLGSALWIIPGERMKAGREHRIPLSPNAVALLRSMPVNGEFVFPGQRGNPHVVTDSVLKLVKKLFKEAVSHGFRSTFRDWCADMTNYARETAEQALAHVTMDETEAAYRRSDLLAKRAPLMKDWADFFDSESKRGEEE